MYFLLLLLQAYCISNHSFLWFDTVNRKCSLAKLCALRIYLNELEFHVRDAAKLYDIRDTLIGWTHLGHRSVALNLLELANWCTYV
jgi:hypothetical protein